MSTKTLYKFVDSEYRTPTTIRPREKCITLEIGHTYDRDDYDQVDAYDEVEGWGFTAYASVESSWLYGHPGPLPSDWHLLELTIDTADVIRIGWYPPQLGGARGYPPPGQILVKRITVASEVEDWADIFDSDTAFTWDGGLPL